MAVFHQNAHTTTRECSSAKAQAILGTIQASTMPIMANLKNRMQKAKSLCMRLISFGWATLINMVLFLTPSIYSNCHITIEAIAPRCCPISLFSFPLIFGICCNLLYSLYFTVSNTIIDCCKRTDRRMLCACFTGMKRSLKQRTICWNYYILLLCHLSLSRHSASFGRILRTIDAALRKF